MTRTQVSAIGPSGQTVAANIRRLRDTQRLTYADLSRQLSQLGRPIPVLGLRRIERGERRVDADDLAALAIALTVSPLALLLPREDQPGTPVMVTGGGSVTAAQAWLWGVGTKPLAFAGSDTDGECIRFQLDSLPPLADRLTEHSGRVRRPQ